MKTKENAYICICAIQMEGNMDQIVYMSTAKVNIKTPDVLKILEQARQANEEHNITGFLVYYDGCFLQVIEGQEDAISSLWENIQKDERHFDIRLIGKNKIQENEFPQWSMGFIDATAAQASEHLGGVQITEPNDFLEYVKTPSMALKVLQGFARSYTFGDS